MLLRWRAPQSGSALRRLAVPNTFRERGPLSASKFASARCQRLDTSSTCARACVAFGRAEPRQRQPTFDGGAFEKPGGIDQLAGSRSDGRPMS